MSDRLSLIEPHLARVAKPARYIGGEWNETRKDHAAVDFTFALAFPDVYDIGMSNLGLRILYNILNQISDVAAERVFAPWVDMESEMRQSSYASGRQFVPKHIPHGIPLLSLETQTPLREFDAIGFSLAYELTYTNVLNMLDLAGIPVLSSERTNDDPIILAGGHCAFNPEPMADFVDAFVIGEGEEVVLEVVDSMKKSRAGSRSDRLKDLAKVQGVYVPSLYEVHYNSNGTIESIVSTCEEAPSKITKRTLIEFNNAPFPNSPIVPWLETPHDRVMLEIMRGCVKGCRFCQAGMITRPMRQKDRAELMRQAEQLLAATGYDEVAMISLSSADYVGINELVKDLIDKYSGDRVGVSLPSLRADADCVSLAAEIQRVRKSGLTFAPEAGTQRLRDAINKNVTEENLLAAVSAALEHGWRKIKLYFMIGLPTETDEDIAGIAEMTRGIMQLARQRRKPLTINVSVSSFVPKPHTPFQWRAQDTPEELQRKIDLLQQLIRDRNVQLSWHPPTGSLLEAVLARGDRRLGKVILAAWRNGATFDGWNEQHDFSKWTAAFEETGIEPAFYANRRRSYDEVLPWDHIDSGITKRFLTVQDKLADKAKSTIDCVNGPCLNCGVDDLLPDERSCSARSANLQKD